jgi:DNA polymerase I-like protein with 3'-5' exonuclease and polymerase domains
MTQALIALDIETRPTEKTDLPYALEPYRVLTGESAISSVATFNSEHQAYQLVYGRETTSDLSDLLEKHKGRIVYCHNAIFDVGFMYAELRKEYGHRYASDLMATIRWRDTAILYKYLINGQEATSRNISYSLKACIQRTIKDHPHLEDFLDMKENAPKPGENAEYWLWRGQLDAEMTLLLAEYLESKLTDDMKPGYLAACSAIWPLAEGWVQGIDIDTEAVTEYQIKALARQKEITNKLGIPGTSLTSTKQLGHLLFNTMGYEPIMRTPKGAPSCNAESMLRLHQKHSEDERLGLIMEYRKINTMVSKYVDGFLKASQYLGVNKMHASPRILSTITGRMTYNSQLFKKFQVAIAQHQIPRKDKGIKRCMVPPKGYKVLYMDVSAQEGRFMAMMGPEPTMIRAYNEGMDLHSDLTEEIFGTPYSRIVQANKTGEPKEIVEQRQAGKLTGLSSFYRIGADALARKFFSTYEYDIDRNTAYSYLKSFKRKYPGVVRYWDTAIAQAKQKGYAVAIGGWRYRIKKFDWKGESSAINHPIQGSGAIQTYATIGVIKRKWPTCILVAQVHDAVIYFVPEDIALETAKDIKSTMDRFDYGSILGFEQTVPIILDVAIGDNLADLTDIRDL